MGNSAPMQAQQGALTGLPGLTTTSQPNLTSASTFSLPQLSGNQTYFGAQGQQMNPLTSAVANILSGNSQK